MTVVDTYQKRLDKRRQELFDQWWKREVGRGIPITDNDADLGVLKAYAKQAFYSGWGSAVRRVRKPKEGKWMIPDLSKGAPYGALVVTEKDIPTLVNIAFAARAFLIGDQDSDILLHHLRFWVRKLFKSLRPPEAH